MIAVAAAFSLVCAGYKEHRDAATTNELREAIAPPVERIAAGSQFRLTVRVDLDRRRWCFDDACSATSALASIGPAKIVFSSGCSEGFCGRFDVDRETGEFHWRALTRSGLTVASGTCSKREGRPLPKPKF